MNLEIVDASFHRNGIAGIGFWAVLFVDHGEDHRLMIASLFEVEERGFCAVYDVAELQKQNVAFAMGNSWRGDNYEDALRPLLEQWNERHGTNQIGPFSIPDVRPERN